MMKGKKRKGWLVKARPGGSVRAAATVLCALTVWCLPAAARTILLNAEDCDRMAGIAESAPRLSWAMARYGDGVFHNSQVSLSQESALLLRFSLDKVPAGQRIVHAELIVPVSAWGGNEPRFYLWRLLADWGPGVCYLYRSTRPEYTEWTKPGARGISSDRATRPTDIVRGADPGDVVINVTEDVGLWYGGGAPNHGWLFTVEDPGVAVTLASPAWAAPETWTLRITYEPEAEQ